MHTKELVYINKLRDELIFELHISEKGVRKNFAELDKIPWQLIFYYNISIVSGLESLEEAKEEERRKQRWIN